MTHRKQQSYAVTAEFESGISTFGEQAKTHSVYLMSHKCKASKRKCKNKIVVRCCVFIPHLAVLNKELVNNGNAKKCSFIYFSFDEKCGKIYFFFCQPNYF